MAIAIVCGADGSVVIESDGKKILIDPPEVTDQVDRPPETPVTAPGPRIKIIIGPLPPRPPPMTVINVRESVDGWENQIPIDLLLSLDDIANGALLDEEVLATLLAKAEALETDMPLSINVRSSTGQMIDAGLLSSHLRRLASDIGKRIELNIWPRTDSE